jgi:hypothetical protein
MRSTRWTRDLGDEFELVWPAELARFTPGDMFRVELGLFLLRDVMPDRAAQDAWTLFGGYPYAEALGYVRSEDQRLMIRRARHYLWLMRRPRVWLTALENYLRVPAEYRGYTLEGIQAVPEKRAPARASGRFDRYSELLTSPPAFEQRKVPLATAGEYIFPVRDRTYSVTFTAELAAAPPTPQYDLDEDPTGKGKPLTAGWPDLEQAAREMDKLEEPLPEQARGDWVNRLSRVKLFVRQDKKFTQGVPLTIAGTLHLVGMVGAGKSTLRDILTYWCATQHEQRVTIVVGDVAEALAVTEIFNRLGVAAAPILGHSTRERHIQRLHRRLASILVSAT